VIFHIASRQELQAAESLTQYAPPGWSDEGFIRCCTQPRLRTVANSYFRGQPGLVVLGIDEELLEAEVRWEPPSAPMEGVSPMDRFPHVYGPINTDAVTDVADLVEGDGGEWICRLL
jgi:uncharacterized protein (DUF952 family)